MSLTPVKHLHSYLRIAIIAFLMPLTAMQSSVRTPRVCGRVKLNIKDDQKDKFSNLSTSYFYQMFSSFKIESSDNSSLIKQTKANEPDISLNLIPGTNKDKAFFDIIEPGKDKNQKAHITVEVAEGLPIDKLDGYQQGMNAAAFVKQWKPACMKGVRFHPIEIELLSDPEYEITVLDNMVKYLVPSRKVISLSDRSDRRSYFLRADKIDTLIRQNLYNDIDDLDIVIRGKFIKDEEESSIGLGDILSLVAIAAIAGVGGFLFVRKKVRETEKKDVLASTGLARRTPSKKLYS